MLRLASKTFHPGVGRWFSTARPLLVASAFSMPSMSPTMTEGTISEWKVKEGSKYSAGDILLTIETDKAQVDIEAQDDGFLGKIFRENGTSGIPVGETIAAIGEEEDDDFESIKPSTFSSSSSAESSDNKTSSSEQQQPKTSSSQSSLSPSPSASSSSTSSPPRHSKPLLPSVLLLLEKAGIEDANKVKGTGMHGMLTKGDVLAFLGKASGPIGTASKLTPILNIPTNIQKGAPKLRDPTDAELRRMITIGLSKSSPPLKIPTKPEATFDSLIEEYMPTKTLSSSLPSSATVKIFSPGNKNSFPTSENSIDAIISSA